MVENQSAGEPDALAPDFIKAIREEAKALDFESKKLRHEAASLVARAEVKYEAYIQFDLLADKLEAKLEKALAARQKGGEA
jgi:hypothetical protein